jgi:hypothetical protein
LSSVKHYMEYVQMSDAQQPTVIDDLPSEEI